MDDPIGSWETPKPSSPNAPQPVPVPATPPQMPPLPVSLSATPLPPTVPSNPPPVTPPPPSFQRAVPSHLAAPAPELKQSGLGISSMILAIVVGFLLFIVLIIAGVLHNQGRGPQDPMTGVIGLLAIFLMGIDIVALALGIAGLCQKGRRKVFSVLGVVFSSGILLGSLGLIVLGLTVGARMR